MSTKEKLTAELRKVSALYEENFQRLLDSEGEDKEVVKRERELNKKDVAIRRELGLYLPGPRMPKKGKESAGPGRHPRKPLNYTTETKDIIKVRNILRYKQFKGLLSGAQVRALGLLKKKSAKKMTEEEKQKVLEVYRGSFERARNGKMGADGHD